MKKIILFLFLLFPFFANAQDTGWIIENFHADIYIKTNGKVEVKEYIQTDFNTLQKHGIYRDIPLMYDENGQKTILKIKPVSVTDFSGNSIKYKITKTLDNINFKIGDPGIFVTGKQEYLITYEVEGALRDLGDVDELFWNVTGNNWPIPISKITSNIFLPENISVIESGCFEGQLYSKKKCPVNGFVNNNAYFASSEGLSTGSGLSTYVTYKSGIIPAIILYPKPFYLKLEFLVFIIIVLIAIIINIINWYRNGRDYMFTRNKLYDKEREHTLKPVFHKEPITVMYEPPNNLRPGMMGTLIDEKFHVEDFVSTVIDLVVRGYIEIEEKEPEPWYKLEFGKDYYLKKLKDSDDSLLKYEQITLESIFFGHSRVSLSTFKKDFHSQFLRIQESVYDQIEKEKLFVKNLGKIYLKSGVFIMASFLFAWILLSLEIKSYIVWTICFAFSVSSLISIIFRKIMPQKTAKGRELYIESLGYREFIKSVDKYRAKFYEDNNMFVNTLPYAIMFGMTDKFLDLMKEIGVNTNNVHGFKSYDGNMMNISMFSDNISSFSNSLSQIKTSAPRVQGSGFSGGGFGGGGFSGGGGGGGGSW